MIVVGIVSLFFVATALSAAAFFGSTPIVVLAAIGAFFFFDLSFFRTETPKKIFFLGKEVGETREGNNFIPLRKVFFRMEGEKKRSSGEISKTIRMILRLMALFVIEFWNSCCSALELRRQGDKNSNESRRPWGNTECPDPRREDSISCRGRWMSNRREISALCSAGGHEKIISCDGYGLCSCQHPRWKCLPEKVTIFLSVFN